MRRPTVQLIVIVGVWAWTLPAVACGPNTAALVKSVEAMDKPPLFRCGSHFNDMLAHAHRKQWPGALKAYQAHLKWIGKSGAETADEKATLQYLQQRARTKS